MCVLFYICRFDKYSEKEFYKAINVFATAISDIFRNYINLLQETAFKNSVTDELPKNTQEISPKLDPEPCIRQICVF